MTYDIIEPFRPMVDGVVYRNRDKTFDSLAREKLLGLLQAIVIYDGKRIELSSALERYIADVIRSMECEDNLIKEFDFDEKQ